MTGDESVMGKADRPTSRQVPHGEPRKPGRLAGRIWIAPDFDHTPEDIIAAFEGDLDGGEDRLAEN